MVKDEKICHANSRHKTEVFILITDFKTKIQGDNSQ